MARIFFLGATLLGLATATIDFQINSCSEGGSEDLLSLPSKSINPYPIKVPGDLTVSGQAVFHREARPGDFKLELHIQRKVTFIWITVPCIAEVGSCTYDACALLEENFGNGTSGCPPQFVEQGLPCTCPVAPGQYVLDHAVFSIPEMSGVLSWLAEGDYKVEMKLVDNASGQTIACQQLQGTIVDGHPPCSGFLCSIIG